MKCLWKWQNFQIFRLSIIIQSLEYIILNKYVHTLKNSWNLFKLKVWVFYELQKFIYYKTLYNFTSSSAGGKSPLMNKTISQITTWTSHDITLIKILKAFEVNWTETQDGGSCICMKQEKTKVVPVSVTQMSGLI